MPDEIQNIFDDVVELKKANPWLGSFALTDNEVKETIKLISRVIFGAIKLDNFFSELKKVVRKDEGVVKKLALSAITNRFLPLQEQLGNVEGLLEKLGSSVKEVTKPIPDRPEVKEKTVISFSPQDDEEIKKIISTVGVSQNVHDYNSLAELIIAESGYDLGGDEVILARLKNMVIARLKDIRDELETAEALKKSRKIGGLAMTDEEAKRIINLVKEKISQGLLSKIEEKPTTVKPAIIFPQKKPFAPVKTTLEAKKNGAPRPETEIRKIEPLKTEIIKASPIMMPQIEEEDGLPVIKMPPGEELKVKPRPVILAEKIISEVKEAEQPFFTRPLPNQPVKIEKIIPVISPTIARPQPLPEPQPKIRSLAPPKARRYGKPSVDGVRVEPILVGPVEELGTMTLINFRRLGETPHQAIAKIKEKVDLLEKDSYAKKIAGVEAWHKNEINRFYRLLGQASLNQGVSIDDIISARLRENKPTLSIEEFNSVMELNRSLRY